LFTAQRHALLSSPGGERNPFDDDDDFKWLAIGGKNGKSRGEISSQPVVYLFYNADEQRLREIEQGKRKLK
jgi:hypothetical protein